MGNILKIGNEYYVEFYGNGLLFRKKAGSDRQCAEKMLADIESEMSRTHVGKDVTHIDAAVFFKKFLKHAKNIHTHKTYRRYIHAVGHFQGFLENNFPDVLKLYDITPKILEAYQRYLLQDQKTLNKRQKIDLADFELFLLRDVFNFGISQGHINDNPLLHIRYSSGRREARSVTISDGELQKLCGFASDKLKYALWVVSGTGLRLSEVLRLNWDDVNWQETKLRVTFQRSRDGENGDCRYVPLDPPMIMLLQSLEKVKHGEDLVFSGLDPEVLRAELSEAVRKAGLPEKINFEILRNTFACRLLKQGVDLFIVYRIMGFSDIAMMMRFRDCVAERMI